MWVYVLDGSIQCQSKDVADIATEEQRLIDLVGDDHILERRSIHLTMPAICGLPTGSGYAFKLTQAGARTLFNGVVGPSRFHPLVDQIEDVSSAPDLTSTGNGDSWVPMPWKNSEADSVERAYFYEMLQTAQLPHLLVELIGRRIRVYQRGDMITLDYLPRRVNIEIDETNTVLRIHPG